MIFTITPAAVPPGYGEALVSLEEAKAWLRVTYDEEDALIAALRDAAVDLAEQYCSIFLRPREGMVATFTGFPCPVVPLRLGRGPEATIAVTGIVYVDSDGEEVMLAEEEWRVDAGGALIPPIGETWPTAGGSVTVTYDVGYPAQACPPTLLLAVKMLLAHFFSNREGAATQGMEGDLPPGICARLDRFRLITI